MPGQETGTSSPAPASSKDPAALGGAVARFNPRREPVRLPIRIEVSSSNFPRFARNLNTGGNNFDEKEGVVAINTVHHAQQRPSRIVLPVIGSD